MGIEQIRMNQTMALPPVPQFNWSQAALNRMIRLLHARKSPNEDSAGRSGGMRSKFQPKTQVPKTETWGTRHPAYGNK
jgi:hypothetical protein